MHTSMLYYVYKTNGGNKMSTGKNKVEHEVYNTDWINRKIEEEEIKSLMREEYITRGTASTLLRIQLREDIQREWDTIKDIIKALDLVFIEGDGGTWQGRFRILKTMTPRNFLGMLSNYDDIKITENSNGRVNFTCAHQDATDYFELRMVNDRGVKRYNFSGLTVGVNRNNDNEQIDYFTRNLRLRKKLGWL